MARYTKTPGPAVERVLGVVAAVVWFATQGAAWLRLLVGGVALAVVLGLAHTALAPVRGTASTWGPSTAPVVLAPAWSPTAAPALVVAHG